VEDESLHASRIAPDNGFAGAAGQLVPAAFPKGFMQGFMKRFLESPLEGFLKSFARVARPNEARTASRDQSFEGRLDVPVERGGRDVRPAQQNPSALQ